MSMEAGNRVWRVLVRRILRFWPLAAMLALVILVAFGRSYACESEGDAHRVVCDNFPYWHLLWHWWSAKKLNADWYVAIFTGLLCVISAGQWFMFFRQLGAMRRAGDQADDAL